ncbi:hypothetical protein F5884DRAFT_815920 [Xylogone sp. PMI_703]|nr:hypothetical protein F5884DRAFT_815920 [Xylogone sp. PMI_703]
MAAAAPSSMLQRLANTLRLLSLRSDIDNILLELLGQFSLEKIYADADREAYQALVVTLLAQLNAIFSSQRLSLPSENLQLGWYLGFLASWEVTVRAVEFVLQVVVEGRESLWEARLLMQKYLAELLLNALRFLALHPKIPSNQRAKDRRDRFARIHRSLERVFDSYSIAESPHPPFLLLVCREITDALRTEPNGMPLPARLRTELPNVATELVREQNTLYPFTPSLLPPNKKYPLPECLQSQYVSTIVPQDGFPGDWLSQFYALRDVSQFVVGASVQFIAKGETRDMRLQVTSAKTRNAVLHALEYIYMPQHLSKIDLVASFADIFRVILPDTLNIGRSDMSDPHYEHESDALDSLCTKLADRQIVNRLSDHEIMSNISMITKEIELLDNPTGQFRASRPKLYTVNCKSCHTVGESQLRRSDNYQFSLDDQEAPEINLPSTSTCLICGEEVTLMREILAVRHTWDRLKPLESNSDAASVERHGPTQFQLTAPKAELFPHGYNPLSGRHASFDAGEQIPPPPIRPIFPPSSDQMRSIHQALQSPISPTSRPILDIPSTELSHSEGFGSSEGMSYMNTPGTTDPQEKTSIAVPDPLSPQISSQESNPRLQSVSTVSFRSDQLVRSETVPTAPPLEKKTSRWMSKLTTSKKEASKSSGDSSSLSSTTLEAQRLEEVSLKSLITTSKFSMRGRNAKTINVTLSQNSTYVLFWNQSSINIWDASTSPPILGRAISTESSCVLAAVTKKHLAYIIGTRDQRLTLRIVNLIEAAVPVVEYKMPSSQWCHSICICPTENYVVVGFDNATVRLFKTTRTSEEPREDRLHSRIHRDCRNCPPVETLSFSNDGLFLLASTRNLRNGWIQLYSWRFPFDDSTELNLCRYHVPLHESEDNGVSAALFRSGMGLDDNLVCITTWTQSGTPVLFQPQDGLKTEIRTQASGHQGKLGTRIQCATFSATGRELAMVNDKGHLYYISNLNSNPLDVRRIATSKELTTKTDGFAMTFMSLPDEDVIVLAWSDSSKGIGYVKKIPIKINTQNPLSPITPLTPTPHFIPPIPVELPSDEREIPKPPVELNVTEANMPAPLNITKGKEKS